VTRSATPVPRDDKPGAGHEAINRSEGNKNVTDEENAKVIAAQKRFMSRQEPIADTIDGLEDTALFFGFSEEPATSAEMAEFADQLDGFKKIARIIPAFMDIQRARDVECCEEFESTAAEIGMIVYRRALDGDRTVLALIRRMLAAK
jgi:hypothetical protein